MATQKSTDLITTLASPPDVTQSYFDKLLLMRSEYFLFHSRWATKRGLKHRQGKNIIFRRYSYLAQMLAELNEGEPPTGKSLTFTDFQALLRQYGDFVAYSDLVEMTQTDPYMNEMTELLGNQMGYSIDSIDRDTAVAGTSNIVYSNGTARTAVNTIVDNNDLDRLIRSMQSSGARKLIGGSQVSSANSNMYPVRPGYPCVTSPEVQYDLENVPGYRPIEQYKSGGGTYEGEVGRYRELCFFIAPDPDSLNAGAKIYGAGGGSSTSVANTTTSGTADVHTILAFGQEYFSTVPLDGETSRTFFNAIGSAGSLDPIHQVGTQGWKNTSARLRTNESWGGRIETAVTI